MAIFSGSCGGTEVFGGAAGVVIGIDFGECGRHLAALATFGRRLGDVFARLKAWRNVFLTCSDTPVR